MFLHVLGHGNVLKRIVCIFEEFLHPLFDVESVIVHFIENLLRLNNLLRRKKVSVLLIFVAKLFFEAIPELLNVV